MYAGLGLNNTLTNYDPDTVAFRKTCRGGAIIIHFILQSLFVNRLLEQVEKVDDFFNARSAKRCFMFVCRNFFLNYEN